MADPSPMKYFNDGCWPVKNPAPPPQKKKKKKKIKAEERIPKKSAAAQIFGETGEKGGQTHNFLSHNPTGKKTSVLFVSFFCVSLPVTMPENLCLQIFGETSGGGQLTPFFALFSLPFRRPCNFLPRCSNQEKNPPPPLDSPFLPLRTRKKVLFAESSNLGGGGRKSFFLRFVVAFCHTLLLYCR